MAAEFLDGLLACGTTTALVFGSHFAPAMDVLFAGAEQRGLNITAGLVLSDRILRPDLLCTPEQAAAESRKLIERWHGKGRLRYAVTPRFSLSASDEILAVCGELLHAGEPTTSGSPRTSTRTWPRSRPSPTCSPGPGTTWTPTTGTAW